MQNICCAILRIIFAFMIPTQNVSCHGKIILIFEDIPLPLPIENMFCFSVSRAQILYLKLRQNRGRKIRLRFNGSSESQKPWNGNYRKLRTPQYGI